MRFQLAVVKAARDLGLASSFCVLLRKWACEHSPLPVGKPCVCDAVPTCAKLELFLAWESPHQTQTLGFQGRTAAGRPAYLLDLRCENGQHLVAAVAVVLAFAFLLQKPLAVHIVVELVASVFVVAVAVVVVAVVVAAAVVAAVAVAAAAVAPATASLSLRKLSEEQQQQQPQQPQQPRQQQGARRTSRCRRHRRPVVPSQAESGTLW